MTRWSVEERRNPCLASDLSRHSGGFAEGETEVEAGYGWEGYGMHWFEFEFGAMFLILHFLTGAKFLARVNKACVN